MGPIPYLYGTPGKASIIMSSLVMQKPINLCHEHPVVTKLHISLNWVLFYLICSYLSNGRYKIVMCMGKTYLSVCVCNFSNTITSKGSSGMRHWDWRHWDPIQLCFWRPKAEEILNIQNTVTQLEGSQGAGVKISCSYTQWGISRTSLS